MPLLAAPRSVWHFVQRCVPLRRTREESAGSDPAQRRRRRASVASPVMQPEHGRYLPLAIAVAADHPDRPRTLAQCPPDAPAT